jgi:hypothetical protein
MEKNNKLISIPISVIDVVDKTNKDLILGLESRSDLGKMDLTINTCVYNNYLLYNFFYLLTKNSFEKIGIDTSGFDIKSVGVGGKSKRRFGKRHFSKRRSLQDKRRSIQGKRRSIQGKSRRRRHIGGVGNQLFVSASVALFAIVFLFMSGNVKSVLNVTHSSLVDDLRKSFSVADIFKNKYGTCAPNVLLFMKVIGLDKFSELTTQIISQRQYMPKAQVSEYLNRKMGINEIWDIQPIEYDVENAKKSMSNKLLSKYISYVNSQSGADKSLMDKYILSIYLLEDIREKMKGLRKKLFNEVPNSIVTYASLPGINSKGIGAGHAVTLWLTPDDKLLLIDPQKFIYSDVVVVFSEDFFREKDIEIWRLTDYFVNLIDFRVGRSYYIMSQIHEQIYDINDENTLSINNPKIMKIISQLKTVQEKREIEDLQSEL